MDTNLSVLEIGKIDENIGNGAYATVVKCCLKDGTKCAVKKVHDILLEECEKEGKTNLIEIVMREARMMSIVDHPNIVQFKGVHSPSTNKNRPPHIVMELCQKSLRTHFNDSTDMQIKDKLTILLDIAAALCYLHCHKVVHCDLTPNNILLTKDSVSKIGDFGSARIIPSSGKLHYRVPGTPSYMPPEALARKCSYNEKLDIYSFGCIMHFLLTGKEFAPGKAFQQPSQNPLQRLIRHCIESNPENRPDASMVYESLRSIFDNLNSTESENTDIDLPAHKSVHAFINGESKPAVCSGSVYFSLIVLLSLLFSNGNCFNCVNTQINLFSFDKVTETMKIIAGSYYSDFCTLLSQLFKLIYQSIISLTAIIKSDRIASIQTQSKKLCSTQTLRHLIIGLVVIYMAPPVSPANIVSGANSYYADYTLAPDKESYMSNYKAAYLQPVTTMVQVECPLQISENNVSFVFEEIYQGLSSYSTMDEPHTSMHLSRHNDIPMTKEIDYTQYTFSSANDTVLMDGIDNASNIPDLLQCRYSLMTTTEYKKLFYNLFLNFIYVLQQGILAECQCTNLPSTIQIYRHVSYHRTEFNSLTDCQSCQKDSCNNLTKGISTIFQPYTTTPHAYGYHDKYMSWCLDYNKSIDNSTLGLPCQFIRLTDKDVANDTIPAIIQGNIYLYKQHIHTNATNSLTSLHWNYTQIRNPTIALCHIWLESSTISVPANSKLSCFKFFHVTSTQFVIPGLHRQVFNDGTVYFHCKTVIVIKATEEKLLLAHLRLSQKHGLIHLHKRIYIVNHNKAPVDINPWYSNGHGHCFVHAQINSNIFQKVESDNVIVIKLRFGDLLLFFIVLLVLIVHGILAIVQYHYNKRDRDIKFAHYSLHTRIPGHLNVQRNNTLSPVLYFDTFEPSFKNLMKCDLRSNHFAMNIFHQNLSTSIVGNTIHENNRILLRDGYFQDIVGECFKDCSAVLHVIRVYLSNDDNLRCYLELTIYFRFGTITSYKLHALVTNSGDLYSSSQLQSVQQQSLGLILLVVAKQRFYETAWNNSFLSANHIDCASNDQWPVVPLPLIYFQHCFPFLFDPFNWLHDEVTFPEECSEEHDTTPLAMVTGSIDYLNENMHESDSPCENRWHLTAGRKLDLHISNILHHEDNSQLVSGCGHDFNITEMFADDCDDNTKIITQRMNKTALEFAAELHHYNQPLLSYEEYNRTISVDFEDQLTSAPVVEEHNEEYYEEAPVQPPMERFDQCLKLKHFTTQQGVGGNGQILERGLDTDNDYEALPYPVKVTDRNECNIRALMMTAVLQNSQWEISVFEEGDSSSHGSDECEHFHLRSLVDAEGGRTI